MTKRETLRIAHQESVLESLGFTPGQAVALRRISLTLRRWYEQECGDGNQYGSWAIERDDNGDGKPFMVHHHYRHGKSPDTISRTPIADRERGAIKRLAAIVKDRNERHAPTPGTLTVCPNCEQWQRPVKDARVADCLHECRKRGFAPMPVPSSLSYYIQTDPRGCALYILRPGDVPDGADAGSYYSRGIAIY